VTFYDSKITLLTRTRNSVIRQSRCNDGKEQVKFIRYISGVNSVNSHLIKK